MHTNARAARRPAALRRLLACLLLAACAPAAAEQYTFTTGPVSARWSGSDWWKGEHVLPGVYCVRFPRPDSASSFEEGFLNGGRISFFRVRYRDSLAAYVVTSTLPRGRKAAEEYAQLAANERQNADRVGAAYQFTTTPAMFGPAIALQLDNVLEHHDSGPFPLVRPMFAAGDGGLVSTSAHRLFVRGPDRFEVAVLGLPQSDDVTAAAAVRAKVAAFADAILASLQACTAGIPIRESRTDGGGS